MRRAWILPALALACTLENPRFLLAGDGGERATTDGERVTTGSTGATTGSSGAGSSESSDATAATVTDATATSTAPIDEPPPLCPLWDEPRLALEFTYKGAPLEPPAGCPNTSYRGNGKLATDSLTLFDDGLCNDNLDGDFKLEVGYVGVSLPIILGCFQVDLAWNADCTEVRSATLWGFAFGTKVLLAVGVVGSALPPYAAPPELVPQLTPTDACSCQAASCCAPEGPAPGAYALRFDALDLTLAPGESAKIKLGDNSYDLVNLRSHVHADCVDPPLHLDWYAAGTP